MRRWMTSTLVVLALLAAPLSAELKVTQRMSITKVAGAAQPEGILAGMGDMMGAMFDQMFGGAEGVESVMYMHEDGRTRTEYAKSFAGMPAGAVVLTKADGTSVGFDAKAGTWWKMSDPAAGGDPMMAEMLAQMKPTVTMNRSGRKEEIAGLSAEHATMTVRMPIPLPAGVDLSQLPPELSAMIPKEIVVEGDTWISPQHAKYTKAVAASMSLGPLSQFGLDDLAASVNGLVLRQTMRVSLMAGFQMEQVVLKVSEEAAPAGAFDLPTGLKEIPMPTPQIR